MLGEMTAAQLQMGVSIAGGVVTIIVVVAGLFVNAWRSGRAHEGQKAEMRAEVASIKGTVNMGFATVNARIDNLQDMTRQSLNEGTRRMERHSQNITDLRNQVGDTAEDLAQVKGQLGIS
jgi:hypothetical protein